LHRIIKEPTMNQGKRTVLRRDEIERIIGQVSDDVAVRLIATGANAEQLLEAFEWLSGAKTPGEEAERPLSGPVAQAYDVLSALEPPADEDAFRD
jgi:hypothetical protein